VIDSERACPGLVLSWQGDFGPFSFAAQMSAGTPSTTDDGSRVSAHFWHPSLKTSTSAHFEAALAIDNNLDKKGKDTALAYLQALTSSRSIFISKLDSSAANTDAELDTAASAYLSLLLGTVNDYAPASNPAELDHETGQLLMLSPTVSANLHYVTLRHWS
jgi:hypothetical protein